MPNDGALAKDIHPDLAEHTMVYLRYYTGAVPVGVHDTRAKLIDQALRRRG